MACPKKRKLDPLCTVKIFWMGDVGVNLKSLDLGTKKPVTTRITFSTFFWRPGNLELHLHLATATKWGGRIQGIQNSRRGLNLVW